MNHRIIIIILIIAILFSGINVFAQDEKPDPAIQNESIEVGKLYQPILAKAKKINFSPDAMQIKSETPVYNDYQVPNKFLTLKFDPPSLKPLALKKTRTAVDPNDGSIYSCWLKAGFGNNLTPLVDFSCNTRKANSNIMGVNLKHLSSRLKGDYPQDFMENEGKVFGKFFTESSYLNVDVNFEHDRFFYYGFDKGDTLIYPNDKKDIRVIYNAIPINLEFGNKTDLLSKIHYKTNLNYHYFWSNIGMTEHYIGFDSYITKDFDSGLGVGLNLKTDYSSSTDSLLASFDQRTPFAFNAIPHLYYKKPFGLIKAGASLIVDQTEFVPFPYIYAEGHIIEKYLTVYAGLEKNYRFNNYKFISDANPFIGPSHDLTNTINRSIYGGFKGNVGSNFSFDIGIESAEIQNQLLFNNYAFDTTQFRVIYDPEVSKFAVKSTLAYLLNSRSNISLTTTYNKYSASENEKVWHLPALNLDLGMNFALTNKLNVGSDIMYFAKIYARNSDGNVVNLKNIFDVNLSVDYQINQNFYLFADANNIINSKYQRFLNYPSYGFNAFGGVILRF